MLNLMDLMKPLNPKLPNPMELLNLDPLSILYATPSRRWQWQGLKETQMSRD